MNTQAHNIMLTNNGTVSEHGAVPQARVVADCPHPPKSDRFDKVCLCFTKREARLLSTDHCSLITRHLPINNLTGSPYVGVDPATRQQKETFTFDQTGNCSHTTHTAPWWLDQTRTHNAANQITSLTEPTGVVQPTYDAAGNMTTMPRPGEWATPFYCTWDAWNRLVKVRFPTSGSSSSSDSSGSESSWSDSSSSESSWSDSSSSDSSCSDSSCSDSSGSDSSSSEVSSSSSGDGYEECIYQYDALTRRVKTSALGETRDIYFNRQWRAIEERVADAVKAQYIWNPADR